MKAAVFLGPTLPADEARHLLPAEYLPPAAQGDLYRVAREHPKAIILIDGYFERMPSVWHKEILWALSEGIHVFGCSSMGALRAAELAPFGMVGIGAIADAYMNGTLERDDEVAVIHASEGDRFKPLSEPLVNIRWTLDAAVRDGVLTGMDRDVLIAVASDLHYPDRSYPALLAATREHLQAAILDKLRTWLPTGAVDQKRDDAMLTLRRVRDLLDAGLQAVQVPWTFEHTEGWDRLVLSAGARTTHSVADGEALLSEAVMDELRLDPGEHDRVFRAALTRYLARDYAARRQIRLGTDRTTQTIHDFRHRHGLHERADVEGWLAGQHFTETDFRRLMQDQAIVDWLQSSLAQEIDGLILDELRIAGTYPTYTARATAKLEALASTGMWNYSTSDAGISPEELHRWLKETRHSFDGEPDEKAARAASHRFRGDDALQRAALREMVYQRLRPGTG